VDAARPMVFATTLLLLAIVIVLNLFAIGLRNRLRRTYAMSTV
jgi:phosphate transport system permease protein